MFSAAVLDHFQSPRNVGEIPNDTARVEVTNPVCGDVLHLSACVENDRIIEARFLCQGCTTAIACASLLTVELTHKTLEETRAISANSLSKSLGELPPATHHAAELAFDALTQLLIKLKSN
jgi:nitrogen fixation protein NifU and related proteins